MPTPDLSKLLKDVNSILHAHDKESTTTSNSALARCQQKNKERLVSENVQFSGSKSAFTEVSSTIKVDLQQL